MSNKLSMSVHYHVKSYTLFTCNMIARLLKQRECGGGAGTVNTQIKKLVLLRQRKKRKVLQGWKMWKDVKEINAMIETGHVRFRLASSSN